LVFAVEIDSQSTTHAKEDIIRGAKEELPKRAIVLDEKINERCIALVRSFGLRFAALDLVIDNNVVPYFLDINPTGDWWWMKHLISLSITKSIVDLIENLGQWKV
jgi:glutathione synthase/RimK-type ligase-like ATP-grasp enzyme